MQVRALAWAAGCNGISIIFFADAVVIPLEKLEELSNNEFELDFLTELPGEAEYYRTSTSRSFNRPTFFPEDWESAINSTTKVEEDEPQTENRIDEDEHFDFEFRFESNNTKELSLDFDALGDDDDDEDKPSELPEEEEDSREKTTENNVEKLTEDRARWQTLALNQAVAGLIESLSVTNGSAMRVSAVENPKVDPVLAHYKKMSGWLFG